MLEITFRSIIQFRQHVGSIHAQTQSCASMRTHTQIQLPWHPYAFCMFLSHWQCVCVMCWRAWWPKQPEAFPQGWHFHYALTTGTASVQAQRSVRQTLTASLPLICILPLLLPHQGSFRKGFWHMFAFPEHNFNICHRWNDHETCRTALEAFNLLPFIFCWLLPNIVTGK